VTNLKQKSTDARRHRRTRLKRAMLPIIELLGCTQMGAADAVKGVFAQNNYLMDEIKRKDTMLSEMRSFTDKLLAEKDAKIEALKAEIQDFVLRRDELSLQIESLQSSVDNNINTYNAAVQEREGIIAALNENIDKKVVEFASAIESKDTEIAELKVVIRDLRATE
jgi:chromosome segregation ATPase